MSYNFLKMASLKTGLFLSCAVSLPVFAQAEDFQQALVSAYQHNPLLMAERARVREIDENYVQAKAAGGFTVNADGTLGRTRSEATSLGLFGNTSSSSSWVTPHTGQISIVKPLYQGGRVKGLKAQAKAGVLAARQGLRNAEQTVFLSVATAYLDVLRDEEAAIIRRNNVKVLTRQRMAALDRFEVGEGTRTDIAQAEARLAGAEIGLAQADAQLAVSRAAYLRFTGHVPQQLIRPPEFILPKTLHASQMQARTNNPQLVAARYNENAARAAVNVAKAAGRPNLALNGALQGSRDTSLSLPRAESASITAQLRIPIYSGGLNQSRVRAARQASMRTKYETRDAEQEIDQAVANLWAQIDASQRSLQASKKQVQAAEVAFEGVELEQQVGTRNTLDVLDAEQELLNAKLTVLQAERNLNLANYQLLVTMGGFDAYSLQLPVDMYDPQRNFDIVSANPFEKYIPQSVEKIANQLPNIPKDLYRFSKAKPIVHKIKKDSQDVFRALVSDKAVGVTGENVARSLEPSKNTNLETIFPVPILIKTEEKQRTQ